VGNLNADGLTFPTGGSVDSNGNLFVADFLNNRVLEYLALFTGGTQLNSIFAFQNFRLLSRASLHTKCRKGLARDS
jgi:hypothetical protein